MLRLTRYVLVPIIALLGLATLAASPATAQDASDLLLRTTRLENQMRQMSGQIEQLQFENKKLRDQLTKFQQDVEFRFQDAQPKAAGTAPGKPPAPAPAPPPQPQQKRSDAFDPNEQPNAPGAPRPLGSTVGQAESVGGSAVAGGAVVGALGAGIVAPEADTRRNGPLDLSAIGRGVPSELPQGALPSAALPSELPASPAPGVAAGVSGNTASLSPPATARDAYDEAFGLVHQKQYPEAEMALRSFVQAYPRDPNVPSAIYWLGETYLRRNMHADAAEQYLKVYQSYPNAAVAPEGLYKLALALKGLNQKDQACATLAEVGRRYPTASQGFKATVEREIKRTNC